GRPILSGNAFRQTGAALMHRTGVIRPPAGTASGNMRWHMLTLAVPALLGMLGVTQAQAQLALPSATLLSHQDGSHTWSLSVETLVMLTMLSFLPAMLLM